MDRYNPPTDGQLVAERLSGMMENHEISAVRLPARITVIGPGRLVLVVGRSGAGKDTLIGLAQAACADDPGVVFP